MGRHSTGKNNYALSKGAMALLAVIVLLACLAAYVFFGRGNSDESTNAGGTDAPECVAGDLALPVAASSQQVGRTLIDDYSKTNPVVRDYCVRPVLVDSLSDAAVYIAPNTPIAQQELDDAGRAAATNETPAVTTVPAGLAGSTEVNADEVDLADVDFPTGDQPEASALVAAQIAADDAEAESALEEQKIANTSEATGQSDRLVATAEDAVPEGLSFSAIEGADLVYTAIPLTTSDAVSEDQARAGQAFADSAGKLFLDANGSSAETPEIDDSVWAAAFPAGAKRTATADSTSSDSAEAPEGSDSGSGDVDTAATDTLFLLDTSAAMSTYAVAAEEGIAEAAKALAGDGHRVGLWNYSSPLSPGVNKGYRANMSLTANGDEIARVVTRFLNDGTPRTREALAAAVDYAESEADSATPVRIVLITSGTADGVETDLTEAVKQAGDNNVSFNVVHVGDGEKDQKIADAAAVTVEARSADELADAIVRVAMAE